MARQVYKWLNSHKETLIRENNFLVLGVKHLGLFQNTFVSEKGLCIGFVGIVIPLVYISGNSCVGFTTLGFDTSFT